MKVLKIALCTIGALFIVLVAAVLLLDDDDKSSNYTNGGQFSDIEDLHGSPFSKSYGNYDGTWEPPAKKGAFTKAWSWSNSDECIAYAYTDDYGEEAYEYASGGVGSCEDYALFQEVCELSEFLSSLDAEQLNEFLSSLSRKERADFLEVMEYIDNNFGDQPGALGMKDMFEKMFAYLDSNGGGGDDDGDYDYEDDDDDYGGYAQSDDDDDDYDDDDGQEYAQSDDDDDDDDYGAQVAQADDDEDYEEEDYAPSGSGAVAASDEEESFRPGGSGATIATGGSGNRPSGGNGSSGSGGGSSEVASGEPYEDEFLANFGSLVL